MIGGCCTEEKEEEEEEEARSYLVPSHAVLLAERLLVLQPAQTGPRVASCSTAELDRVGSRHRMQTLLHLCRRGPVWRPCSQKGVFSQEKSSRSQTGYSRTTGAAFPTPPEPPHARR